jgi:hypothetical protein
LQTSILLISHGTSDPDEFVEGTDPLIWDSVES